MFLYCLFYRGAGVKTSPIRTQELFSVNSSKLNRTVWIVKNAEEGVDLLNDGIARENIYTEKEVELVKGCSERAINLIQTAKDLFPGGTISAFTTEPELCRAIDASPEKESAKATAEPVETQMKLL